MVLYTLPARSVITAPAGLRLCSFRPHPPFRASPHSFPLAPISTSTRHFYSHPSPSLLLCHQRIFPCRQLHLLGNLTSRKPPPLTRSQRTSFPHGPLPFSSANLPSSGRTITNIFIAICLINYVAFVYAVKQAKKNRHFYWHFICNYQLVGSSSLTDGHYWALLSHSFLHTNPLHLVTNMLALYSLGPVVARVFGTQWFVVTWICGGAVSASVELLGWGEETRQYIIQKFGIENYNDNNNNNKNQEAIRRKIFKVHYGATGSLMTFLAMVTCFAPRCTCRPFPIPINVPLYIITTGLGLFSIMNIATGWLTLAAHDAHLGGLTAGFLYYYLWIRGRRRLPLRY